jgi:hypothetical protein
VFAPFVELVKTLDLPGWLVHWGHPGNMVRLHCCIVRVSNYSSSKNNNYEKFTLRMPQRVCRNNLLAGIA